MNVNRKTVLFMHLHRTGGTTLLKVLESFYDANETFAIDGKRHRCSVQDFIRQPEAKRGKFRMIKGHLFWGLHHFCLNEATYITILRHPIDRVLSLYYWQLRPDCFYSIPAGTTLEDFLASGEFVSVDNGMTRFIAGKDLDEVPYGMCTGKTLELAKDHLARHFAAFGLTERYEESLILFKRSLGWERFPFFQKVNVHQQKPAHPVISAREQEALLLHNAYDLELYGFARMIFEDRISQMVASFADEVALFKHLNASPFPSVPGEPVR
jgi:hypothetical protein